MSNDRQVSREVRDEYVETMSKIYYSYFKSYSSRTMKLQVLVTTSTALTTVLAYICCCKVLSIHQSPCERDNFVVNIKGLSTVL